MPTLFQRCLRIKSIFRGLRNRLKGDNSLKGGMLLAIDVPASTKVVHPKGVQLRMAIAVKYRKVKYTPLKGV